jgi:FkbM family methyltransferase
MKVLKNFAKSLAQKMGFTISRINPKTQKSVFSPFRATSGEELLHIKQLGFKPNLIIDLGAANGESPFIYIFPESEYIWVEPCEEFRPSLEALTKKHKGIYHIAACGESVSETKIHVYDGLYGSSILENADQKNLITQERVVPMVSVDSIVTNEHLEKGNIILKADVQGFELNILKGAEKTLDYCEVIFLETCLFDTFIKGGDLTEIILYLNGKGFKPYAFVDGCNRPYDQSLFQIDVFFVKDSGFFRKSHHWAQDAQYEKWKQGNKAT